MSGKLWLISLSHNKAALDLHCFGDCGKILVGGVTDVQLGAMFPCNIEVCPHLEHEQTGDAFGTVDGCDAYLRRVKET